MNHTEHTEVQSHREGGHGWMMIACCIPLLVIAVVLVATGVVTAGFLFIALGCMAMMALMMVMMMRGMSGGGQTHS
jgi:amino acid transporter